MGNVVVGLSVIMRTCGEYYLIILIYELPLTLEQKLCELA